MPGAGNSTRVSHVGGRAQCCELSLLLHRVCPGGVGRSWRQELDSGSSPDTVLRDVDILPSAQNTGPNPSPSVSLIGCLQGPWGGHVASVGCTPECYWRELVSCILGHVCIALSFLPHHLSPYLCLVPFFLFHLFVFSNSYSMIMHHLCNN